MAGSVTSSAITLKGSSDIVTEFFEYGINSILYQRGIYPPETFIQTQKYGLTILVTTNEELKKYLHVVLNQLKSWLNANMVHSLVVVISNIETKQTLERWVFKIECDSAYTIDGKPKQKDIKEIQRGIRDVIRQITASITFLPLLDALCAFDLLIYTHKNTSVPVEWAETAPHFIPGSQEVRLKSFSTSIHTVETAVQYKSPDDS